VRQVRTCGNFLGTGKVQEVTENIFCDYNPKEEVIMATEKPNILILWGDDVGWWNISYNSRGQMGYRTPNIDRVGNEGAELHRRPSRVHYRAEPRPNRPHQGGYAWR
jgi:hypothetical protein